MYNDGMTYVKCRKKRAEHVHPSHLMHVRNHQEETDSFSFISVIDSKRDRSMFTECIPFGFIDFVLSTQSDIFILYIYE